MEPKENAQEAEETGAHMTEMSQPIIVDLGKQKSKKLKALKNGEGVLWDDMLEVVDEVRDMLGEEADGKMLVPIVMLYEKKSKRKRIERLLFPLAK